MTVDPRTLRLVALLIGAVALLCVGGALALALTDRTIDAALTGLAGTALGYLAGLLTNPSATHQPVELTAQLVDADGATAGALTPPPDPDTPRRTRPRQVAKN